MDKFYKEFYASRLDDWKNKYIKLLELRKLVKLIVKDIEKHGGKIERNNGRNSILEDSRSSIQLDRRSVGLSALEDKENLFNKNTPIFESPIMFEIENTFKEIEYLSYSDDIKIFLYFLQIEVHNVYVFYLSKEKEIYNKTNEHLYKRKNLEKMGENEVLEELDDLTEIAYLTYSFYLYADLNVEAVRQILKYFDEHFISVNDNTSLKKLYFNKYLSKNESDLKYILSFKIVIESTALLESYGKELIKLYPDNSEIKSKAKELNDVLAYLISKNTDRVNDDIYEIYINSDKKGGGIIKQKRQVDIDIQNSFFIDIHKADDYLKMLEELQYDKRMRIKITVKNKINICILFLYIFFNSIFYIIPYFSLYFNCKETKEKKEDKLFVFFGIILSSTHIGTLVSRLIYSCFSKFKNAYIFYCVCFMFSLLLISSLFFIKLEDKIFGKFAPIIPVIIYSVSRFLLGFSNERIITRKYLILFIPESIMKNFSIVFLIISYIGLITGACLTFFIDLFPKLSIPIIDIELEKESYIYIIGVIISIILLFVILILFTEPNKDEDGNMLIQQIVSLSQVTDDIDVEEYKKGNERKYERYEVKDDVSSSINQTRTYSDGLIFKENNKEIKIDNNSIIDDDSLKIVDDDDSMKLIENKIITKDELQGLNSMEKDIIIMNESQNFNDVNLLGNELERIKKNQIKNNKVFIKSFIAFILALFLCNMINEYIIIKTPFILEKIFQNPNKWIFSSSYIILLVFSFPFLIFCRIIKKFDIERRLLLIIYLFILLIMVGTGVFIYFCPNQQMPLLAIIFVIYILNNCLEGVTHLLIEKIIPSFVKFCGKNMKYLFSYMGHIGKAAGGIIFFLFYFFPFTKEEKILEFFECVSFVAITFIFFVISIFCYKSLRVRAFAKLNFEQDSN